MEHQLRLEANDDSIHPDAHDAPDAPDARDARDAHNPHGIGIVTSPSKLTSTTLY